MAQPNKFQFILNIRGVIVDVLTNAPDGWLNTAIKFTRSKTYNGLFRGETTPAKYVGDGATLLRKEFYKYGILGYVRNIINQQNPGNWLYNQIYSGQLDFSTAVDELTSFTVNSISNDFSVQLNANDGTKYAIPLSVDEAVNVELTALALGEQASFVPGAPPDGIIHSDYFIPMQLASNQQNSVNYSSQGLAYAQQRAPNFSTSVDNFFFCRYAGKVKITGSITYTIRSAVVDTLRLYICNQNGPSSGMVLLIESILATPGQNTTRTFVFNHVLPAALNDRWFLYMEEVSGEASDTGITINGGEIDLAYQTISPPTMCQALPANYVFGQLLQAMNTNRDSGPNQPVPYKSNLLTGVLNNLLITSSDSIKQATGSIVKPGDTVFPGSYIVRGGSVLYGGQTFADGVTFPYRPGTLTYSTTDGAVIQKVISGFVGAVYNPGDTLQAGGTYVVGGNAGTFITYNGINYAVGGPPFKWVLGFDTFTGSDDSSFVEQVAVATQLILTFKDFYQSIYAVMGGNCSFGIENLMGVNTCFIEDLPYVFRGSIGNLDCGKVDTQIKFQPATDMLCNSIKVGFQDQQYSQVNGYSEVNSNQTYKTSILTPQKELNLVSVIRADPYGIEEVRISQNDTASSRSDNDNFFIYRKDSPESTSPITYYHPLRASDATQYSGVDGSYYNWILSPKHNLLRGAPYLASIFYGMKGYRLTLSAALKNTAMVITNGGVRVSEAEAVQISNLGNPLFIPVYATFKPGLVNNALSMIDNTPYGFIKFTYNGTQYKIFADSISVDIGQNTQQEFKGLFTPANDLTTLVH